MGEAAVEFGNMPSVRSVICMEGNCGALLTELKQLWAEVGKSKDDKDRMLLELEIECMQVYRRKVDEASSERAQLHQSLAAKESEIAALMASLGENSPQLKMNKRTLSLNEQLLSATTLLEDLRMMKAERSKQFADMRSQIEKITAEIAGWNYGYDTPPKTSEMDDHDLSIRRLTEYKTRLSNLQKEKSDRLHKVLEHVTEVHSLCDVLGEDFTVVVNGVHPGLHEADPSMSTSISDGTLSSLSQVVAMLTAEKSKRVNKLRETVVPLVELWNLMDSPEEERRRFRKVTSILSPAKEELLCSGVLSLATIKQTEDEVDRLMRLKSGRMKELVLKRRLELEKMCRSAHIEPDTSTVPEKSIALIDSGLVNPSELLVSIEEQIGKAKEELLSRKEIMDKIDKWLLACEEEKWLEEYTLDENRFNTGRVARMNLKRAEKARAIINKIPAIVDSLMNRTLGWENERKKPFLYDEARLVAILEEYKQARLRKEQERRRFREQKKLRTLLTEKEAANCSMPNLKRAGIFNRRAEVCNMNRKRTDADRFTYPARSVRSVCMGSAAAELLTPRSSAGHCSEFFKGMKHFSTAPLNYVAIPKGGSMSSLALVGGSERGTPFLY